MIQKNVENGNNQEDIWDTQYKREFYTKDEVYVDSYADQLVGEIY